MDVEIERKIADNMKEVYTFWYKDFVLYLDGYRCMLRESPRHHYKTIKEYSRLNHGRSWDQKMMSKDQVPLSEDIKRQALVKFTSKISVELWER